MSVIIANKYKILESIGEGTFGKVFKGKNIRTNENIAIKIQYKDIANVLRHEAKIYKQLKDISGIPQIRHFGTDSGFNYLIIDLLNSSLQDLSLTQQDTIKYMILAINIIETVHDQGIIHRDIKPDNFLLKNNNLLRPELFLIDFGLSKYYLNNNIHMEQRKDRNLIGTAKFASLNVHNGIEISRRDDIESLCYTFIILYSKQLPWSKIIDQYDKNSDLLELYNEIKKEKEQLEWLHNIPGEFLTLLLYSRTLKFDQKPNYNYMRTLLENLLKIL